MIYNTKPSQNVNILGELISKRFLFFIVGTVLIVIGAVAGLVYYFLLAGSALPVPIPVAPTAIVAEPKASSHDNQPNGKVPPESPLVTLLEEHLEVTQLKDIESLIVHGMTTCADATSELIIMARRPNLYTLKKGAGRESAFQFGYNGEQGWIKPPEMLNLNREIAEFYMRVRLFESSFVHLAWSYLSEKALIYGLDSVLERLPDEQWQGRACALIVSRGLLPFAIYHYIDLESREEVYRRAQVLRGTDLVSLEIYFSSSEAAASPRLPMGYALYIDGTLNDNVTYTKIRRNRMLFESLFSIPVDATTTGLSSRRSPTD